MKTSIKERKLNFIEKNKKNKYQPKRSYNIILQ
jgi:hypothetical protein